MYKQLGAAVASLPLPKPGPSVTQTRHEPGNCRAFQELWEECIKSLVSLATDATKDVNFEGLLSVKKR